MLLLAINAFAMDGGLRIGAADSAGKALLHRAGAAWRR
jgi:hypothetical protein